ncbi:TPA: hypothetical protein N0F65_007636 [Lagenidium giganteum]|uniref:Uncharacterized protein n=1 Tax=Lagenidium giganteum TaxID=4803 RepID=A0AAV2Z7C2_9STRA|nr:TPA: hypothetical protein N0F65_007636 [Lagenidium giganteum]
MASGTTKAPALEADADDAGIVEAGSLSSSVAENMRMTLNEPVVVAQANIEGTAFVAWRSTMEEHLQTETTALKNRVLALQTEFDEASHYIRGDYAWRKQLVSFHDRLNEALELQLIDLVTKLQENGDSLTKSIGETFQSKDLATKQELEAQAKMYEDKLRRTRLSLKNEIDRFTHLERCLRREETNQAKEMYQRRIEQLQQEHYSKEAELQAILREFKSSYTSIELMNIQLMDTLKNSREEIARLKKMLPKPGSAVNVSPTRANSQVGHSPTRWSVANATEAYVSSLKHSLAVSNQTIDGLRKQVEDLGNEKETLQRRVRGSEESLHRVTDELSRARQLLSESHDSLLENKKRIEVLETDKNQLHDSLIDLQQRTASIQHDRDDARRYAQATTELMRALELQVAEHRTHVERKKTLKGQFSQLRDQAPAEAPAEDIVKLVESFLHDSSGDNTWTAASGSLSPRGQQQHELETRLRHEYEQRYGEQLNIRISHERKRVLARIELLCQRRQQEALANSANNLARYLPRRASRTQVVKEKLSITSQRPRAALDWKAVHQIVSEAFEHLGFAEWSFTDLDALHDQIDALKDRLAECEAKIQEQQQALDGQNVTIAQFQLVEKEKELLLVELTERHRDLRCAYDALKHGPDHPDRNSIDFGQRSPLTVYGQPQSLELKKPRPRPVSAAPCVPNPSGSATESLLGNSKATRDRIVRPASSAGIPPSSRLKQRLPSCTSTSRSHGIQPKGFLHSTSVETQDMTDPRREDQQEEHILSQLKSHLLVTPTENQLDDGGVVGADGVSHFSVLIAQWVNAVEAYCSYVSQVLQILQRRKHRK